VYGVCITSYSPADCSNLQGRLFFVEHSFLCNDTWLPNRVETMTNKEKGARTNSLKLYVALLLVSVVSVPTIFFLFFLQIIPFTSRLTPEVGLLVIALASSLFAIIILFLMFGVAIPLSGQKIDVRLKSPRVWFFSWVLVTIIASSIVFFSSVYDTLFPTLGSDLRSLLSPLTVLLIFLVLASPPLKDKTTNFFEKVFRTKNA
jgi:hypothetical protein